MILTISTTDYRLIKDFDQELCSGAVKELLQELGSCSCLRISQRGHFQDL